MSGRSDRRRALVTGGAVRIGRAICEVLAERAFDIIIHCRRSVDAAKMLCGELTERYGVAAQWVQGDLSSSTESQQVFSEAWDRADGFHVLVNNAAVFHRDTLETATWDDVVGECAVNFSAPAFLKKARSKHS